MRKLWAAVAAVLSLVVVPAVVDVAPASANSTCNVSAPQINNSYFCAKATLFYSGYYYVSFALQIKSTGYTGQLQVQASNGTWYGGTASQANYDPFGPGVVSNTMGPFGQRPIRVRVVLTNSYTGAKSTYSWNPFPPV